LCLRPIPTESAPIAMAILEKLNAGGAPPAGQIPPSGPSNKTCIFCGNGGGPFHKEDVLPKWIAKEFRKAWIKVTSRETGHTFVTRGHLGLVSRAPCKTCNSGWMSRLETAVKPIIVPMMKGEKRTLSQEDQLALARWVMKTVMMMEFLPDVTTALFEPADRFNFYQSLAIPSRTVMCIARWFNSDC
jgi:hypothetical protein